MYPLFLREKEREKDISVRETQQWAASWVRPDWVLHQPPSGVLDDAPTNWATENFKLSPRIAKTCHLFADRAPVLAQLKGWVSVFITYTFFIIMTPQTFIKMQVRVILEVTANYGQCHGDQYKPCVCAMAHFLGFVCFTMALDGTCSIGNCTVRIIALFKMRFYIWVL